MYDGGDEMIPKGCTCKNIFSCPYVISDIKGLFITYQQKGEIILEKKLSDCSFFPGKVSVMLSQEDTLKFYDDEIVKIQIRIKLQNDVFVKSKIIETYTDIVLKNEVI